MGAQGRRERTRQETKRKLMAAAMTLFGERGFLETRVEDITSRADVGKGTFFNYFPSKEAILQRLRARVRSPGTPTTTNP